MHYRSHKIKMFPTVEQERRLYSTAGACRYAYNWFIDEGKKAYKEYQDGIITEYPNSYALIKRWIRNKPDWAKETSAKSQTHESFNVVAALKNHFSGRGKMPTYHKRGSKDSFYCPNDSIRWFNDGRVSIHKIGRVKLAEPLRFSGKINGYVVSREGNSWYIAVNVSTEDPTISDDAPDSIIGVDVGLSHVATTSEGETLDLPAVLENLEKQRKKQQKRLARSKKIKVVRNGAEITEFSKNGKKKLRRLRAIQERINNVRKDAAHKFTTAVCKNHATVVIETLDVQGMVEKAPKSLRRSFARSMMRIILEQLQYKAKHVIKAPRFFASSKTCSRCGSKKENLSLSDRVFVCDSCGLTIDRDFNAAINLMNTPWVTGEASVESARQRAL